METKRILNLAGGTAAFIVAVAVGALAIVSLSPGDKRAPIGAQQALLLEAATAEKPFHAPAAGSATASAAPNVDPDVLREEAPAPRGKPQQTALREPPPAAGLKRNDGQPKGDLKVPRAQEAPSPPAPRAQPRKDGLLTSGEIRRMRLSLQLTRDQEPYWPAVEQALLELGAQQEAMVRAGQDPKDAFGVGAGMRIYSAARPLLDVLREDQKAQVRARARALGFGSIASSI